jgi:division/cell wall cluster transcriptional repressor MraZ
MPDINEIVPSFHGISRHAVDDSRRVMIPVKWRPKDPAVVFTVLAWPLDGEEYLLVLPPERWRVMLNKLKENSLHDPDVAVLERVIGRNSVPLTLDRVGRFALPDNLAKLVGIDKEAEFVGRLDKFEIWSPKRLEKAMAQDNKSLAASVAKRINL